MSEFVASNGIKIRIDSPYLDQKFEGSGWHGLGSEATTLALREFFQNERDAALGRWRDPDNPRLTAYPTKGYENDEITILDEVDAETYTIVRSTAERSQGGWWHDTAKAYFAAHPERKPWHDATPGEIWLLATPDESDVPAIASSSENGHVILTAATHDAGGTQEFSPTSVYITHARKIWPEEHS